MVIAVAPLAVVAAVACGDSSTTPAVTLADGGDARADTTDDAAPVVDGGCALPASFGSAKCNECVGTKCCDVLATCSDDSSCKPLMACTLACIDRPDASGCAGECASTYSDDGGKWDAVVRCAYEPQTCRFHCAVGP